jgi:hypothetical protein
VLRKSRRKTNQNEKITAAIEAVIETIKIVVATTKPSIVKIVTVVLERLLIINAVPTNRTLILVKIRLNRIVMDVESPIGRPLRKIQIDPHQTVLPPKKLLRPLLAS